MSASERSGPLVDTLMSLEHYAIDSIAIFNCYSSLTFN